ncbi:hypothetical protein LMG27952_01201 [Paraburkholderia hiiakae]|uniref:Uncharacterized protein n=1 Tax=Paraburkholderia hiiakae TaxID=1081782 RepID=A0ABM8NEB1_9BURK|nr:hypothetical protein LMG27952_01201 [Paraburkholderia hiiakae]
MADVLKRLWVFVLRIVVMATFPVSTWLVAALQRKIRDDALVARLQAERESCQRLRQLSQQATRSRTFSSSLSGKRDPPFAANILDSRIDSKPA